MKSRRWLRILGGSVATFVCILAVVYLCFDKEKITLNDEIRSMLPGRFVELQDGVVHYELAGPQNATTVVLVHGFSVPFYVWDPTFDALVDAGFRVLRYDLYGRGYSDRPEVGYDLELFTKQLRQLLSALDIHEPVDLIGLSMGGPIVAAFSNQYPDRVGSLCLIDPQVSPVSAAELFPMNIPLVGEYLMAVYVAPIMLPESQANDFYKPERFPDWEEKYRDQMQYMGFRRAILSTMRNIMGIDAIAEYRGVGELKRRVLLVWGREDQSLTLAEMETVQEVIPEVEFYPIDYAGHLSHYERPEVVNPLLIEFLKTRQLR
jgi:pimeloyl-ACP methyl ester carboxylesterase